ncbi:MAG TPA: hypothetical protein VFW34_03295 [Candidatus Rubrimentiphilum sp.]|nr:hypothetical protein [Candidatus Rubrimentiphilum sp.]
MRRKLSTLSALAALALAACGGGSSGYGTTPHTITPGSSSRQVTLAFTGVSSLSAGRQTQSVGGTAVTLTLNGKIVGKGTLDATGKVTIELDDAVPAGSTITVTAGSTTVTFVLATSAHDTAVMVQRNADGTLTVTTAGGEQPEMNPDPNDPDGEQEVEDGQGDTEMVSDNDGHAVLPSNLPITVTNTCTTITIAAKSGQSFSRLRFEENVRDGDGGSKLKFDGPFTSPQTFALIAQSARIRIELFDANGKQVLDVRAPIGAFTAVAGQPTPSPCPSVSPGASPLPSPSPLPTGTPH